MKITAQQAVEIGSRVAAAVRALNSALDDAFNSGVSVKVRTFDVPKFGEDGPLKVTATCSVDLGQLT